MATCFLISPDVRFHVCHPFMVGSKSFLLITCVSCEGKCWHFTLVLCNNLKITLHNVYTRDAESNYNRVPTTLPVARESHCHLPQLGLQQKKMCDSRGGGDSGKSQKPGSPCPIGNIHFQV